MSSYKFGLKSKTGQGRTLFTTKEWRYCVKLSRLIYVYILFLNGPFSAFVFVFSIPLTLSQKLTGFKVRISGVGSHHRLYQLCHNHSPRREFMFTILIFSKKTLFALSTAPQPRPSFNILVQCVVKNQL